MRVQFAVSVSPERYTHATTIFSSTVFSGRKELSMRVNYAIVLVSDMKRAVSFYRDVLGLPL